MCCFEVLIFEAYCLKMFGGGSTKTIFNNLFLFYKLKNKNHIYGKRETGNFVDQAQRYPHDSFSWHSFYAQFSLDISCCL